MTYIIRTMWISGLFALVTLSVALAYILSVYDPSAVQVCADDVMKATDQSSINAAIKPCMEEFMAANMLYFVNGAIIGAGPVVIYLVFRLAKGVSRATKGHRIGDVKSWF